MPKVGHLKCKTAKDQTNNLRETDNSAKETLKLHPCLVYVTDDATWITSNFFKTHLTV